MRPSAQTYSDLLNEPVNVDNFVTPEPVVPEPAPVVEVETVQAEMPTVAQVARAEAAPDMSQNITEKSVAKTTDELTEKETHDVLTGKNEGFISSVADVATSTSGDQNSINNIA